MPNNHSIYHEHARQHVILNAKTGTFFGVLDQDTHESIHLKPSMVSEPRILLRDGETKSVAHYRWETRRPSIFATLDVSDVQPTTEDYVMSVVNYDKSTESNKDNERGKKK